MKRKACPRIRLGSLFKIFFATLLCLSLVINVYFNTSDNTVVDPFELQMMWRKLGKKHIRDKTRLFKPLERLPRGYNCSAGNEWRQPEQFIEVDEGVLVYSAYYDTRKKGEPFIRVMALTKQGRNAKNTLFCALGSAEKHNAVKMSYYNLNENHRKTYGGGIFSCRVSESEPTPCQVYVFNEAGNSFSLPLHPTKDIAKKDSYGICTPLLDDVDLARFIEFMELSQLLGSSYFIIYKGETVSADLNKALKLYESLGLASVLPWKLPSFEGSLWQHGELLAMNDCMYRSMGKVEFLGFNHIMEFIIPIHNKTAVEFLQHIHSWPYCGYCFGGVFLEPHRNTYGTGIRLITQRSTLRTGEASKHGGRCIVQPSKVFEVGFHHISKQNEERYSARSVRLSDALLFRYSSCLQEENLDILCIAVVSDLSLLRYGEELKRNYEEIAYEVNSLP